MGLFDYGGDIYRGFTQREEFHRQNRRQVAYDFENWKKANPNASAEDIRAYIDSSGAGYRYTGAYPNEAAIDRLGAEGDRRAKQMLREQQYQNTLNEINLDNNFQKIIDNLVMQNDDDDEIVSIIADKFSNGDPEYANEIRQKITSNSVRNRRQVKQQQFMNDNYDRAYQFYQRTPDGDITTILGDVPKSFYEPLREKALSDAEKARQIEEEEMLNGFNATLRNDQDFLLQFASASSEDEKIAKIKRRIGSRSENMSDDQIRSLANDLTLSADRTANNLRADATTKITDYLRANGQSIAQLRNGRVDATVLRQHVRKMADQLANGLIDDATVDQITSSYINVLEQEQESNYQKLQQQYRSQALDASGTQIEAMQGSINTALQGLTNQDFADAVKLVSQDYYVDGADLEALSAASETSEYKGNTAAIAQKIKENAGLFGITPLDEYRQQSMSKYITSQSGGYRPASISQVQQLYEGELNDAQYAIGQAQAAIEAVKKAQANDDQQALRVALDRVHRITPAITQGIAAIDEDLQRRSSDLSWLYHGENQSDAASMLGSLRQQIKAQMQPIVDQLNEASQMEIAAKSKPEFNPELTTRHNFRLRRDIKGIFAQLEAQDLEGSDIPRAVAQALKPLVDANYSTDLDVEDIARQMIDKLDKNRFDYMRPFRSFGQEDIDFQ